jgi:hypothetical protein
VWRLVFEGVGSIREIDAMPAQEILDANRLLDAFQEAKAKANNPKPG